MALVGHDLAGLAGQLAHHQLLSSGGLGHYDFCPKPGAAAADGQMFRTDAGNHGRTLSQFAIVRNRDEGTVGGGDAHLFVATTHRPLDEIHRGRTDETGHKEIFRAVVDVQGRAHLGHLSLVQHHDLFGHRHRLHLIVGDVDRGRLQPAVQLLDFGTHLGTQFCVQVAERFVEQEHLGVAHDGPAHRHPLALTAGQMPGVTVQVFVQSQNFGGPAHPIPDFGPGNFPQLQTERHVVAHLHVGIERVALEHHCDVPIPRRQIVDHPAPDSNLARGHVFQTRDHPQQGRFTAAGRTHQNDKRSVVDVDVDAADDIGSAKRLANAGNSNSSHRVPLTFLGARLWPATDLPVTSQAGEAPRQGFPGTAGLRPDPAIGTAPWSGEARSSRQSPDPGHPPRQRRPRR